MRFPKVFFEIGPILLNMGLFIPVQNTSLEHVSSINYPVRETYALRLGVGYFRCFGEVNQFVHSSEDSVNRVLWVVHHLLNFLFLFIQKLR